jgi:lipopolysaccharide biosynthesis regulator YciM
MIGGIVGRESGYECRQCGFTGKSLHWQCPGCKGWNTTVPRKVSHQPLPVGAPASAPAIGHPAH